MRLALSGMLIMILLKGESLDDPLKDADTAMKAKQLDKALSLAEKAVKLDPRAASAYQMRGIVHFKLGHIAPSIADFDKAIELEPKRKAGHWQRGISYYYAGRFEDGRRQFEGYQTVDANDVENAVWRYLCMARKEKVARARADMLKIGKDARVPMREIYELFLGRLKPADVLAAAKAGNAAKDKLDAQLFYAHLYIGLYFETEGNKKKALEHIAIAADDYPIGDYMWDVARVHRELLRKELRTMR
jgi:lipoprotein NlpI